jgi:hypothetical protein
VDSIQQQLDEINDDFRKVVTASARAADETSSRQSPTSSITMESGVPTYTLQDLRPWLAQRNLLDERLYRRLQANGYTNASFLKLLDEQQLQDMAIHRMRQGPVLIERLLLAVSQDTLPTGKEVGSDGCKR